MHAEMPIYTRKYVYIQVHTYRHKHTHTDMDAHKQGS